MTDTTVYDPWTGIDPTTVVGTDTTTAERDDGFDEWCIVELMGHRRVAARVREATIAGHGYLRLDEPAVGGQPGRTQYVSPGSVYAMHPTTEELVRAMASKWRTAPVQRYELPAATTPAAETSEPAHYPPGELDDHPDYDHEGDFDEDGP